MKKSKNFLCLLLALVMAGSLLLLPAAAANTQQSGAERYPTVYVHGLMGWGARDQIYAVTPYWGLTSDLMPYLTSKGYESYAASVGPLSSAWDRACELYAQLTGTTVDYGAAHAAKYGHARYGVTYDKPLFEGWSADKKINLVGHSFGGATARLLMQLLAHGCPEEVQAAEAAGEAPSPLFTGGKAGWVHALVAIAAPHDGSTFLNVQPDAANALSTLFLGAARALGISAFKGVYDFQLDQFGIRKDDGETFSQALERVLHSDFLSHNDNAFLDLTIDRALEINDDIGIEPNVYYFSYAGNQTVSNAAGDSFSPSPAMWGLFHPGSAKMGRYYDRYTAGGFYINKRWLPNDGMVNTVSAFYPIHSDGTCLTRDGRQGWTNYDGYSNIHFRPGIWYVMPVQSFDHIQFVGGMLNGSLVKTRALYRGIMEDIYSTYTTAATGTAFPFTDVAESRWSYPYIKELYDAGVVSGTSAATFSPAANVTRAQFVTMLAGLAGADVSNCPATPFRDVPEGAWYAPYVNWALANGIVSGTSAVTFSPDASITRQDMAVMLYSYTQRFQVHLQQQPVTPFTDADSIAAYAQIAVQTLQRAGVISGMPDGSFQPFGTATREQACVVLCAL